MEINISQLHSLNMVTINGAVIENVTEYAIKSGRSGKTEVTLTFAIPDTNFIECTVLETPKELT